MTPSNNLTWQPYREPLSTTLKRTVTIALVVGVLLAWRWGRLAYWPMIVLLVLWPSLGGHYVDLLFLNYLRPLLPTSRGVQAIARLIVWFVGGLCLALGMRATAMLMSDHIVHAPAWWIAGVAFIGVELIAHLGLQTMGRPNAYNGQG